MTKADLLMVIVVIALFFWGCVLQSITAEQNTQIDELEKRIERLQQPYKPCPFDYSQVGRMS